MYKFNIWPNYTDTTEIDSILQAMDEGRIFSITKDGDKFLVGDEVDQCFSIELTKDELLALANEMIELANKDG